MAKAPLYNNDLDRHLFAVGSVGVLSLLAGLAGWLFFRSRKPKPKKGWWW